MEALLQHIVILALLTVVVAISSGTGRILLCGDDWHQTSLGQTFIFSTGLGFAILSYSVFLLSSLQCLSRLTVYTLLGALSVSGFIGWRIFYNTLKARVPFNKTISVADRWIGAVLLVAIFFCMMIALTPAVGKDSLSYHLAVPKLYLQHNGFYFIPGNYFSNYPLFGEMLFLVGLVVQGDILAKCIQFSMLLLVLMAMWQYMEQHLPRLSTKTLALLVLVSIPSVFGTAPLAYTDLILTLYSFLAVFAYTNWFHGLHRKWLFLCAIFTGIAVGTKYAGLILPLIGSLGIIVGSYRHQTANSKTFFYLGIYWGITIVVGCPFYVKNLILTGNPFYPLFYEVFGGKGWNAELTRIHDIFLKHLGMGRDFWDYVRLPWNLSFHAKMNSSKFDGVLGPIFISTLPFLFAARKIPTAVKIGLVYCGFMFIFWAASAQQIRYLIPIFPILGMITAYIVNTYKKGTAVHTILIGLIIISIGVNGYHIVSNYRQIQPIPYIIGKENRNTFLERNVPSYAMFRYVNAHLPETANVFLVYMRNFGYLCNRRYYSDSMFESLTIQNILRKASTPETVHNALKQKGFTHILYDERYVSGNLSPLAPHEKNLFEAFRNKFLKWVKTEKQIYHLYSMGQE